MHMYFHIGEFSLPGYSLMILSGMVIANILAVFTVKKRRLDINDFIICEGYILLGAFIGAKLLYLWVSRNQIDWSRFWQPDYFNALMLGGFVFYGGLIGGLATCLAGCRIHKINFVTYISNLIYLIPLVHGFGRIGCFLAGCCYGRPYDGVLAVVFPEGVFAPAGIKLFPVQLVEALLLFVLALLVWTLSNSSKNNSGSIYCYLIGYGIIRFGLEYLRFDEDRGLIGSFSVSQWISIFVAAGAILYYLATHHKKKEVSAR